MYQLTFYQLIYIYFDSTAECVLWQMYILEKVQTAVVKIAVLPAEIIYKFNI